MSCLVVILTAAMAANENTGCSLSRQREHAQTLGTILEFYNITARNTVREHEVGPTSHESVNILEFKPVNYNAHA